MTMKRQTLPREGKSTLLTTTRKGHVGRDIGIYAMLILLVVGEIHVLHRIGQMRSYVDQRDGQVRAGLQHGFQKQLDAENAVQNSALESATKQIERRFLQMQGRARQAQADADRAAQRIEQMQAAEDGALVSVQQMLAQKSSASELRALGRQVAETRADVDFAGAQVAQLRAQVGRLERVTQEQIVDLNEQLAVVRHKSLRFRQFNLVLNHPQAVGGIALVLTGTRQKDGHFNLRLAADGNHLEKKHTAVGEPIFFVPGNPERAYEVVVDRLGRNQVHGFLGAPQKAFPPASDR